MTPLAFQQALAKLDLTWEEISIELGDPPERYSVRCVAYWLSGQRTIPPAVGKLMRIMVEGIDLAG